MILFEKIIQKAIKKEKKLTYKNYKRPDWKQQNTIICYDFSFKAGYAN